jgi:hypothetical protein
MNLLDAGNIVLLIGTLILIRTCLKNRNVLKGYSIIGSLITFLAISVFSCYYIQNELWLSLSLNIPNLAFWFMAFIFSLKQKFK